MTVSEHRIALLRKAAERYRRRSSMETTMTDLVNHPPHIVTVLMDKHTVAATMDEEA